MTRRSSADVLIVGGGGSGLAASLLLTSYGIETYLVSKYAETSRLPKASGLSIKTMEIFRELDLEDAIGSVATPPQYNRSTGYYAGLAGSGPDWNRPILSVPFWDGGGLDDDWRMASTVRSRNLMQNRLEPLMRAKAELAAPDSVQFYHEFIDFEQSAQGVLATIVDRATGERYEVAAKYLLACDGGRVIGPKLGIEMEGHLAVATSVSVHFSADLSTYLKDSEAMLSTIMNPDVGFPCSLVANGPDSWGNRSKEWVVHLLSFAGDHKVLDDEAALALTRRCLGLPDTAIEVHTINRWPLDAVVASKFRVGRVFMLGDAAHRMPPAGGHGLNTAIQDAYNLAWKLALVLKGEAADELLDTYESERRPVAQHTVGVAFAGWQANKDVAQAIGIRPTNSPAENWALVRTTWEEGPAGAEARRRIARVLPSVMGNSNPLNVAHGYVYHDGALISDERTAPFSPDPLALFTASTRPGHSVPDRYLQNFSGRTAIGDLVARGRFVLIAAEDGSAWVDAAKLVARERGIALDAFTVGGAESDWLDPRGAWSRVVDFSPSGAILVRPDRFIAWRSEASSPDGVAELDKVFTKLLKEGSRQLA